MAWAGTEGAQEPQWQEQPKEDSKYRIFLDRGQEGVWLDLEEYLPGVLAVEIPAQYEPEALKAQAVIARTYIRKQMKETKEGTLEIQESALDLDYPQLEQLRQKWGTEEFPALYEKLEIAVKDTKGMVITYEGDYIDPMFCRTSAGMTRRGDENHPYLEPVECPGDPQAPGFTQILAWDAREFAQLVNQIPPGAGEAETAAILPEQIPESIQIVEREEGGYVRQISIGGRLLSGEAVRYGLGLNSCAFELEGQGDGVGARVRGSGHGYGLSQTEANRKAKEGWTAEEILKHFYKNIELVAE